MTGFAALAGPRAATLASHPQIVAFDLVVLLSTFLGTLSLAVARRPAAESLAVVLVVDAALWLLGHSSWAMMVASLLALSACPLLLSRAASVAVLALAEVLVIGAAFGSLSGTLWRLD